MISSMRDLFRLSTLLTIVSALSILLAASPLLSLLPHIYVTIVLIVFVKTLLIFSVTDYSLSIWKAKPFTSFAGECKKLYVDGSGPAKAFCMAVDPASMANFNEVMACILLFPSFS